MPAPLRFEQQILKFIKDNQLISSRGLVLVGVSGGADSMALLLALISLRHDLGIALHVLHYNHQFRPAAAQDERFVCRWCHKLNIPLTVGRRMGGRLKHLSEDEARQLRFGFLVKTVQELHAQSVALAHTRNDLAETVLMRLMRGSGLYGLRAILPKRTMEGVVFVRPLMGIDRRDVEGYLKAKKVPFCTDTTNTMTIYERNKVRLRLLPLLAKEYNPQIVKALSDLAATAGEDYEFLAQHARKAFENSVTVSKNRVKLNLKNIGRKHPAMLRLIFRQMVEALTGKPALLTFDHIHALENAVGQSMNVVVELPHQLKAVKTARFLELYYA